MKRPWELKLFIVQQYQNLFYAFDPADGEWSVDSVMVVPTGGTVGAEEAPRTPLILAGESRSIPEFESRFVRNDSSSKSEHSHVRLHRFMCVCGGAALVAGGFRLVKSFRVSRAWSYARTAVAAHPAILQALGPNAQVVSSSGTFGSRYINATLRVTNDIGKAADVEFCALRDRVVGSASTQWRIAVARMKFDGRKVGLDKS